MEITRRQLRRIIKEASEHAAEARGMAASYQRGYDDGYETPQQPASTGRDPEYLRGYKKGAADAEDGAPQMREATYDQLPYKGGQPWQGDAPVGRGAEQYDDLDMELTDKEIEDVMGWDPADADDEVEYDRGYQDGFDGVPVASDATTDYDAGYEDGQLDATLPERLNEDLPRAEDTDDDFFNQVNPKADWDMGPDVKRDPKRPWGSGSQSSGDSYNDTIVMSPNGDSVLVDGLETYIQDVPSQLEYASGFEMDPTIADVLTTELQRQEQEGYVELSVEYKNGQWEVDI